MLRTVTTGRFSAATVADAAIYQQKMAPGVAFSVRFRLGNVLLVRSEVSTSR